MNCRNLLLSALCVAGLSAPHGWSQQPPRVDPRVDVTKKEVIERGASRVVQRSAELERALTALRGAQPDAQNPTVEPGKVKWHRSLADARAAAQKSGKPVLLFHMMGQLDKQFC